MQWLWFILQEIPQIVKYFFKKDLTLSPAIFSD